MKKNRVCQIIRDIGIIPAIRVSSNEDALFAAEAVALGGIPIVEVTMTIPRAVELIAHIAKHHPDTVVGAGTVLDLNTAKACVDAGASFLTAPGLEPVMVDFAAKTGIAVLPGALTPTEVVKAWKAGADFVKVFPCSQVGGDSYIAALKKSLPQVPLIAAGGVNQKTAEDFILAGATALGVGRDLIPSDAILHRKADRIKELARRFLLAVKEGRERLKG
jgi:2-dehydro-3-deoxyphosphogluconate aldolase/(4S)-4-hydroxy-2-oxoglutarate aldolase